MMIKNYINKTNNTILGLVAIGVVFWGCQNQSKNQSFADKSSNDYEVIADDGAWCWFSDPRAIYYKGNSENIFFGYINRKGDVMIGSKDLDSGNIDHFVLHDSLQIDDHNVPALIILPDGRLMAFYNEHNGNVFMRKSINPEDIGSWEVEKIIGQENDSFNYTYTNPVSLQSEGGRIYVFGRKVGPNRSFDQWRHYFRFSDDGGNTWSEDIIFLDNGRREDPPYMKVISDNLARIDFLVTDGHPKIGEDVSTFHMYYENGVFYQTNGTIIGRKEDLPIVISDINKVYDGTESGVRSWIWDIALDDNRNPVITYARYPTENDHRYHYAYWDGKKWEDQEISRSGGWMPSLRQGDRVLEAHYSGGIVLDPDDPNYVYLSKQIEGKFEIEQKFTNDRVNWESNMITMRSHENNMRPYVVNDSETDQTILIWMNGIYNHYTRYDTNLRIRIER